MAKIIKAESAGFCFGVRRAIKISQEAAKIFKKRGVFMLGDVVHNELVVRKLQSWGIKKVESIKSIPAGAILIIKAHGAGPRVYKESKRKKLKVIDATCPMVKDIHKKAVLLEKRGYKVIIIGDKAHEEVKGICGYIKSYCIISSPKDVKALPPLVDKAGIVCQSTQDPENVASIIKKIIPRCREILFFNTICNPTLQHQKEAQEISKKTDAMFVLGSKKSANTKRLYKICKKINPRTYWITGDTPLEKNILRGVKTIGITAGASTPDFVIEEFKKNIRFLLNNP